MTFAEMLEDGPVDVWFSNGIHLKGPFNVTSGVRRFGLKDEDVTTEVKSWINLVRNSVDKAASIYKFQGLTRLGFTLVGCWPIIDEKQGVFINFDMIKVH